MMGIREGKKAVLSALDTVCRGLPPAQQKKLYESLVKELEKKVDRPPVVKTAKKSQAWKKLEKDSAEVLGGKRIVRGDDFSISRPDVVHPIRSLKIDSKYREKHAHHSLINEIARKYCKKVEDVPVLLTRTHRERSIYATVPAQFLADLIDHFMATGLDLDKSDEFRIGPPAKRLSALRYKKIKRKK